MKILLLGANGQVGWELQRALAPLGSVTALGRNGGGGLCGDLTSLDALAETVTAVRPDTIVNAAAYTAVDRAESEPDLAYLVNRDAPAVLARAAKACDALLVHYSTDYVFDGSGTQAWRESDPTSPLNVYGKTKLAGEQAICESGCRHLVFRTSWVYAAQGSNFIRTMLRLAAERDVLQVVEDQAGAPTGAELIADVTAHAIQIAAEQSALGGTYHLVARGQTNWHGYASFVIEQARQAGWPVKVHRENIKPVGSEAFPAPAQRPGNSRLCVDKLENSFRLTMPKWHIGVQRVLSEIIAEKTAQESCP